MPEERIFRYMGEGVGAPWAPGPNAGGSKPETEKVGPETPNPAPASKPGTPLVINRLRPAD